MFMPHVPPPHIFAPHIPLPQLPAGSGLDLALPAWAENVEYCVVTWSSPHEGQWTPSDSALRRTSFSNLVPQSSQAYSKIGIYLT